MIWPLRYSTMLEHGRCANGSSKGFCGIATVGLVAMISSSTDLSYRCCGAQFSLTVVMLRTLNVGLGSPGMDVPRTVTLWPMCLAKPSCGKPSASRLAIGVNSLSSVRTYWPSCSSTHPVRDVPEGGAFLEGAFSCWAESKGAE